MEEFLINYADVFYKSMERIGESIKIIMPLVITIAILGTAAIIIVGLIGYIYEEIKCYLKNRKGK